MTHRWRWVKPGRVKPTRVARRGRRGDFDRLADRTPADGVALDCSPGTR
ncbi:MAG: hypothetical protein WKF75_14170 [Singulisphaera sp.]